MTNLDSILKSRDITLPTKVRLVKAMVFPWSCIDVRVGLWRRQVPKNWCFWTVLLEKTLESPLDYKEIQPIHSKGVQSWEFFGKNDGKSENPVLWPPHVKIWLIGKTDACMDWGQEEKGMAEDETAGCLHQLDGSESEWTPGDDDGQGGLGCCSHGVSKSRIWLSDWTEQLNWARMSQWF